MMRHQQTGHTAHRRAAQHWVIRICLLYVFILPLNAQQPQSFSLNRFEVVRVNDEDLQRLPSSVRTIFTDPVPDGEPVATLDDAVKRSGYTPLLLKSPDVTQF